MITENEQKFMMNNIFLNLDKEEIDLKDLDLKYFWKTIEVAVKGSLHPEPGIAFWAERLHANVKDSLITAGICYLDLEKLIG